MNTTIYTDLKDGWNEDDELKEKFRCEHSELYMTDEEFEKDLQRRADEVREKRKSIGILRDFNINE